MTIGPAITAALPDLRAQALSLMTDTATITRGTGEPVWDPVTESMSDGITTIYAGPARLLPPSTQTAGVDAAGQAVLVTDRVVAVPHNVTGVEPGDRVSIGDVELVVESAPTGTHMVELRIRCKEQV